MRSATPCARCLRFKCAYDGVREMARQLFDEAFDACERAGIYLIESCQEETDSVISISQAYK